MPKAVFVNWPQKSHMNILRYLVTEKFSNCKIENCKHKLQQQFGEYLAVINLYM